MIERVFYESGTRRIEIIRFTDDLFTWNCGVDNDEYGGPVEWRGFHDTLDDCLLDASGELLGVDDPGFEVSKDQRKEVRSG
jgi:hypothetical protein